MARQRRRQFLRVGTAIGFAGLGGCMGVFDGGSNGDGAEGSPGDRTGIVGGDQPRTWDRTYGNDDFNTSFWGVTPTSDGGYLAAGSEGNEEGLRDAVILKVDGAGNEAWLKSYGGPKWDWLNGLVEHDGRYVGSGSLSTEEQGSGAALLAVERDGDVYWEQTFHGEGARTYGWSMTPTRDDGYLLVGRVDADGWQPFVVKADDEGDEDWRESYLPAGAEGGKFSDVQPTDDGYLLTGSVRDGEERAVAVWIDDAGEEVRRETFGPGILGRVQPVGDGFLIVGQRFEEEEPTALLLRIDPDGREVWSETFVRGPRSSFADVAPLGVSGTGGYLATGWYGDERADTPREIGWIVRVDQQGQKLAETAWNDPGQSFVSSIHRLDASTMLISGWVDADGLDADTNHAMGRLVVTSDLGLEA